MEKWEIISARDEYRDFVFIKGPVPAYDEAFRIEMLDKCKENLCGSYGTNWGCPPGACIDPKELYGATSFVIIVKRTFILDARNRDLTEKAASEMQEGCLSYMLALREAGVDCMAYTDGPCKYCGVCSYPDPCRYPEMRIPSASALGLDMEKYLKSIDEDFAFCQDRMTLYGLFFVQ